MIYVFQNMLYCLLFIAMVKMGVGNNALNGLYFYPKAVRERVYELGLTDRQTVKKKKILFMTAFYSKRHFYLPIVELLKEWSVESEEWSCLIQKIDTLNS